VRSLILKLIEAKLKARHWAIVWGLVFILGILASVLILQDLF